MNAIKIAAAITKFANRVAYKLLVWRWKANLKHGEVITKSSWAAEKSAERLMLEATRLEAEAEVQFDEAAAIREAADQLKD